MLSLDEKKEFPKHFENGKPQKNTAAQLNDFFNIVGNEGWELIEKLEISNQLQNIHYLHPKVL